eukprot:gene11482-607_t
MPGIVHALAVVSMLPGAPDADHGSPLGLAKAVDNDGSMKGMYVYTVQKIETLAEKLESLATKTALNLERITKQTEETSSLRKKIEAVENDQMRGDSDDAERRKMLKELAAELSQLKLAEEKEDLVDHQEKMEQGALKEEVREILSMQRIADEQESEQVNGLLTNLLVKNGLNIIVLVGIIYIYFFSPNFFRPADRSASDGGGYGRGGRRHRGNRFSGGSRRGPGARNRSTMFGRGGGGEGSDGDVERKSSADLADFPHSSRARSSIRSHSFRSQGSSSRSSVRSRQGGSFRTKAM